VRPTVLSERADMSVDERRVAWSLARASLVSLAVSSAPRMAVTRTINERHYALHKSRAAHVGSWDGPAVLLPRQRLKLAGCTPDKQHTKSQPRGNPIAVLGIDIGEN